MVEGSTVFGQQDFAPLYKGMLGKTATLKQIYELAAAITAKYGTAGYILSQALVPAQRITAGVVRLQIVEGFVDQVHVVGKDGATINQRMIKAYGEKIARSRPLRAADLERYLLLMNDLPGISVRAVLEPSKATPGAADLTAVIEKKLIDGYASLDNRGTEFVGPIQGAIGIDVNDLLGIADRTGVRFANAVPTDMLHYEEIHEQIPIGTDGTTLLLTALASQAHPGSSLALSNLMSTNYTGSTNLSHPLIRSRAENLTVRGRLDVENLTTTSNGTLVSEDRLRILRGALSYDFIDTLIATGPAANFAVLELSHGLDIWGASQLGSPNLSRVGMVPDFTKLTLSMSRRQPVFGNWSFLLAGNGQYSFDTLPVSEQIGFGGSEFGRAYDPSQITGDHGILGRAELQYGLEPSYQWVKAYQLYSFFDAGYLWDITQVQGIPLQQGAMSTGVGIRANLTNNFSADLQLAVPLSTVVSPQQNPEPRIFFSIVGRL